jgi:hypothetical protein
MWNPPWILVILSPILWMDYKVSKLLWMSLNSFFLVFAILILLKNDLLRVDLSRKILMIIAMSSFPPMIDCLKFGQLGLLLLIGVVMVYEGLKKERIWALVLGLGIISIKPHLFALFGSFLLAWLFVSKKFFVLSRITFFIGILFFAPIIINLELFLFWVDSMINQPSSEVIFRPWQWKTATISTLLREYFFLREPDLGYSIVLSAWLYFLLPLATIFGVVCRRINWEIAFPLIILFSFILSPFTWYFDMTVLMICYPVLLRFFGSVFLIIFHFGVFLVSHFWLDAQHEFWWFALILLALYLISVTLSRDAARYGSSKRIEQVR